jgi:hypothetical protein
LGARDISVYLYKRSGAPELEFDSMFVTRCGPNARVGRRHG